MKLCKDCKHFYRASVYDPAFCTHEKAPRSPVYGYPNGACEFMRSAHYCQSVPTCGTDGDWWEEAPPKPVQQPPTTSSMHEIEEPEEATGFWASITASIFR